MIGKKKTWDYLGQTINSEKVRIFETSVYIQGRLLDLFIDLLILMSNNMDETLIMAKTGAVGLALSKTTRDMIDQVFCLLKNKGYLLLVVVLTGYILGVQDGTPIAVEIVGKEET